jgi:hypothetical protein
VSLSIILSQYALDYRVRKFCTEKIPSSSETREHRKFLENVGHQLGLKQQEDWFNISKEHIIQQGGQDILYPYDNVDQLEYFESVTRLYWRLYSSFVRCVITQRTKED